MNLVTVRTRRQQHREQFPKPRIAIDDCAVVLSAVLLGAVCLLAQGSTPHSDPSRSGYYPARLACRLLIQTSAG